MLTIFRIAAVKQTEIFIEITANIEKPLHNDFGSVIVLLRERPIYSAGYLCILTPCYSISGLISLRNA